MAYAMSRMRLHFLSRIRRCGLVIACGLAAAISIGCQEAVVEHYEVRHGDNPEQERPRARMLVVTLAHKDATWFFKLVGRDTAVEAHRGEFEEFLHAVRFPDLPTRPIEWKVPEGWKRYAGSPVNYASFRAGATYAPVSFTVTRLGPEAGDKRSNVNRWRNQLGLKPIKDEDVGACVVDLKLEAGPAWLVDIVGATAGETDEGPPPGLTYQKPEGWKERPDPRGVRLVTFQVTDGDQTAEVGVTSLPGAAGGLLANGNRWRDQVGLKPLREDQLKDEASSIQVSGKTGTYLDMTGPEKEGRSTQRILGIALEYGDKTWFFTMKGPKDFVGKQKSAFEAFMQSVRIEQEAGGN
jgi:hypothetical protein